VLQITIFVWYVLAGLGFAASRLSRFESYGSKFLIVAFVASVIGLLIHAHSLWAIVYVDSGLALALTSIFSLIGLQLAAIAIIAGVEPSLRGLCGGLLLLAALAGLATGTGQPEAASELSWQAQGHILISLFSYSLITVGAIVACYALIQDKRLRSAKLSSANQLFAPLETTERLLYGIAGAGFAGLLLAVVSGATFVENLFAQHLAHKTVLSILALILFGILLLGRQFAGWRGKKAIYLYLGGFALLCLAYFGSRAILEYLIGARWG
jgi:ABC-type uncharacterized transport system permease subunit